MSILLKNLTVITKADIPCPKKGDLLIDGDSPPLIDTTGKARVDADEAVDASGKLALPAYTNAHTHLPMILFRGLCEDMVLEEWLERRVYPLESGLTREDVRLGALAGMVEMIRTGTATFVSGYHFSEEIARAAEETGLRAKVGLSISDRETIQFGGASDSLRHAEDVLKRWRDGAGGGSNIDYWLSPHSIYTCSEQTLLRSKELADAYGTMLQMHASETRRECVDCHRRTGKWPVEYLDDIGFLSPRVHLAHTSWLTKMEIPLLARSGTRVVHCPVSNMKLASGAVMPLVELIEAGVEVLLGTDGPVANNSLDMGSEMKFAALVHKAHRWDPAVIGPSTVLEMATYNSRDFMLVDKTDVRMLPAHDLVSNLVYSGASITDLIVGGKFVMRDSEITCIDEEKILGEFDERAAHLAGELED